MDDYEGADEGFRGSAGREAAHGLWPEEDDPIEGSGVSDPETGPRRIHRFPIPGYGDPSESLLSPVTPAGGSDIEMPHWAAPPTGEVPRIVPNRRGGEEALLSNGPASRDRRGSAEHGLPGSGGVGWRDREADWDDPSYEPAHLGDRGAAMGALDEGRMDPEELFSFETFASLDDPPTAEGRQLTEGRQAPDARRPSRRIVIPGRGNPRPAPLEEMAPGGSQQGYGQPGYGRPDADFFADAGSDDGGAEVGHGSGSSRSSAVVRTITGVGIGVLLLLALKVGPAAGLALVVILVTMAAAELYGVLRKAGYQPATLVGLVGTICLMVAVYLKGEAAIGVVVPLTMAVCLLWFLGIESARSTANLAATVLGFFWVGMLGSFAALLLSPALFPDRHGEAFFLGAVIATVAYDVGALIVGSRLGRHPLAPAVSPNKTWEGMVGGIVLCLIISAAIVGRIHPWGTANALALGIVVCVVAPLGDLCESVVKRDLGVKDMGAILPGHGGVLDRLDALLFVIPATYFLVRLLHIGVG